MLSIDAWTGRLTQVNLQKAYDEGNCPCCKGRRFEYLAGQFATGEATLCGRDAVQVTPPGEVRIGFAALANRIKAGASAAARFNAFMLKARIHPYELTVFSDGRAIIKGTSKPDEARAVYVRYIGV